MRRIIAPLLVLSIILALPVVTDVGCTAVGEPTAIHPTLQEDVLTAQATGSGDGLQVVQNMSRTFTGMQTSVLNSYANTTHHSGEIDLDAYSIPGWTTYAVDLAINSLAAAPENEVVGVLNENFNFQVAEITGTFYSGIEQGFYNQPHNGSLLNYSIYYSTDDYTFDRGNASVAIYDGTYDTDFNVTERVNVTEADSVATWATFSGDGVNLTEYTTYWTRINGSALVKYGSPIPTYPIIYWYAEDAAGNFGSYQRGTTLWDVKILEALLNYTYIPWNQNTNSPLLFSGPETIHLTGNAENLTGSDWNFQSTLIQFSSNQSVHLNHNMTIWYQKTATSTTIWSIPASGGAVQWNATTTVAYPIVSGTVTRNMTINKPSDWVPTGLYNSTDLATDYGNYEDLGTSVSCGLMTNGTWTLVSSSHNYIVDLSVPASANILSNVDIIPIIEDELGSPTDSGTSNLTITQGISTIWTPPNRTISSGTTTYTWNIDTSTSNNGTYLIDLFWSNGTEAGYISARMVVYYPTSLTPTTTHIDAFAESSFEVRVDFVETYGPTDLNATYASVEYSFDGNPNEPLTDLLNGTWVSTVSTVGIASGMYNVTVYAEGFAIENQTQVIEIHVTYDTLQLTYSWPGPYGNDISYLQSTNLTVMYNQSDGSAIPGAIVNVTDGTTTWDMYWDAGQEYYWITFNGSDFSSVPSTIPLNTSAWKAGYEGQVNASISLTVQEEASTILIVTWSPLDLSMTYVGNLTLTANYSLDGQPVPGASLVITFDDGTPVVLSFSATDSLWHVTIPADTIGLGSWDVNVNATRIGYLSRASVETLVINEDVPNIDGSWQDNAAETDYDTPIPLSVEVTDSLGNPVVSSNVTVSVQGTSYNMTHSGDGVYSIEIDPQPVRGYHLVVVTITEYGFESTTLSLNLSILTTTEFIVNINPQEVYEAEEIEIAIGFVDSVHGTSIDWGSVNLTIAGEVHLGVYNGSHFIVSFTVTQAPNFYPVNITGFADGCRPNSQDVSIQVREKSYAYITITAITSATEESTISIEATLRMTGTDATIPYVTILFEVWLHFENETILYFQGTDSTNEQGIALWPFTIPAGLDSRVERLEIRVSYDAPPNLWDTVETMAVPVSIGALQQFLNFMFYGTGLYIILAVVVLAIAVGAYNRGIKPKKRAARISLDNQLKTFHDLDAMQHFMAVYVDRGTCVFYHPFKSARIQADLISGFISAVTSVYGEIKGDGVQGTLEEIHYQGLRLNSYSGRYVLGILIMEKEMTPALRDRLAFFIDMFEHEYESHLDGWTGIVDCFDPEWIVSNLMATFGYDWIVPHTIDDPAKMHGLEKKIIGYIKASLGNKKERDFLIADYIQPIAQMIKKTPAEVLDIFVKMEDKEIINPISVHTILLRQGLGLSGLDDIIEEIEISEITEEEAATEEILVKDEESEEQIEEKEEVDPKDQFLADVESLLKKEKDDKNSE